MHHGHGSNDSSAFSIGHARLVPVIHRFVYRLARRPYIHAIEALNGEVAIVAPNVHIQFLATVRALAQIILQLHRLSFPPM